MLVIQPIGGRDDWAALFHEAGHTEHYANTSADLPMEAKRLGDMAVTEGWAMLMEHLVDEPAWLNRRLDVPRVEKIANAGATSLLYFVRRYSAKLLYEIEFFQADDPASMRPRYAELLTEALEAPGEPGELPGRPRRIVLRHRLPSLVGLRGPAADYSEIEGVRQSYGDAALTITDHAFEHEPWNEETKRSNTDHQEQIETALDGDDDSHAKKSQEHARSDINRQMACLAISRLNQPFTSSRNIARGERQSFA